MNNLKAIIKEKEFDIDILEDELDCASSESEKFYIQNQIRMLKLEIYQLKTEYERHIRII